MLSCSPEVIHGVNHSQSRTHPTAGRLQERLPHALQRLLFHAHAPAASRPLSKLPPHIPGSRFEIPDPLPSLRFQPLAVAHTQRNRRQLQRRRSHLGVSEPCQPPHNAAVHQALTAPGASVAATACASAHAKRAARTTAVAGTAALFTHNSVNLTAHTGRICRAFA